MYQPQKFQKNGVTRALVSVLSAVFLFVPAISDAQAAISADLANDPVVSAYMANYIAAQQMFQHKRDDRDQLMLRDENNLNTWMYVKSQYTDGNLIQNNLSYDITTSVAVLGSDFLAKKLINGTIRSGFMLGAGHSDTSANAKNNTRTSSGNVDGYNVGLYATWQQDEKQRIGGYIDTWIAYSWYQNQLIGRNLPDDYYKTKGVTGSVEVGHAWLLPSTSMRTLKLEPQVQAIYSYLDQSEHTTREGYRITTPDRDALTARIGIRMGYVDQQNAEAWQPYLGAHWISGNGESNLAFNGETINSSMPENRYQGEVGVTGNLNKNTTISLRAVGEWGQNSWSAYSGHVLVNHRW